MKFPRLFLLSLLIAAFAAPLSAQPAKTPVVKAVETARVAYINRAALGADGTGIKQLVKAIQSLELEFSIRQSELSLLNEKLRTLSAELNKLSTAPVANAKAMEAKQAEGLRLQQELESKHQQAQTAFNQRQQEVQGPVEVEIAKALRAFAKERDISMLFDAAKLGEALLDARPELDLTVDFIAAYNAKHP
ncbi:MAG: OmpH family outer membrane protein [Lacunisphaera sp.]|nr:OmpH family outer membrane protein [Lacunisphaera sp.]